MTPAEEPAAGEERAAAPRTLRELAGELRAVVADSEKEMETLGRDFEGLAGQTNFVLENAGEIISCIEGGRMGSVLPGVRQLESAAKDFLRERLGATARILEAVTGEAALLERLAQLTRGQKASALGFFQTGGEDEAPRRGGKPPRPVHAAPARAAKSAPEKAAAKGGVHLRLNERAGDKHDQLDGEFERY